jgi:hypothetical protein
VVFELVFSRGGQIRFGLGGIGHIGGHRHDVILEILAPLVVGQQASGNGFTPTLADTVVGTFRNRELVCVHFLASLAVG